MKVQMVARWREAWKWGSVRWALFLAAVAALETQLPALAAYLPEHWVSCVAAAIIVARLLLVQIRSNPEPAWVGASDEARTVSGAMLHWNGIPVHVTGEVVTHKGNWPLIDDPELSRVKVGGSD